VEETHKEKAGPAIEQEKAKKNLLLRETETQKENEESKWRTDRLRNRDRSGGPTIWGTGAHAGGPSFWYLDFRW
jgi:hypothetical protein